ncbi:unnamed protein product [Strongylus vulgaris]|uniref:B30.2/SPRY domain-containing protein n=1 Tax=Strongylus vulgaris TaxID=40348 RepID=A0A3P7LHD5_STRVU|nr:unnamed protein product [Strongylus vulgaris]
MNYGLYSFDESVLTWLRMEGEERNSWLDAIRDNKSKEEKGARLGGQKSNWRSFDTTSVDASETGATPTGQKDVLASNEMPSSGPGRQPTIRRSSLKTQKKKKKEQVVSMEKRGSQVPLDLPNEIQQEDDAQALIDNADKVDEYYYGIRIFPGQDPSQVWVGWVTTQYHYYSPTFQPENVERRGPLCSEAYIAMPPKFQVSGTLIGCIIDTSIGELAFQASGQDTGVRFKLEPGAMLFPAAFFTPTATEILQFELGRIKDGQFFAMIQ